MADTLNWNDEFSTRYGKAVARAWTDPGYKETLLGEPRAALAEVGIDVPAGVNVKVSEQVSEQVSKGGADTLHLGLPPSPEGEISDDELSSATAGLCCCSCWWIFD